MDVVTASWTVDPVGLDSRTNFSCYAYNEGGEGQAAAILLDVHGKQFLHFYNILTLQALPLQLLLPLFKNYTHTPVHYFLQKLHRFPVESNVCPSVQ